MHLVVGPGVVAVLVLAGLLILVAELAPQQAARVIGNTSQPLLHGLLLFLLAAQCFELLGRELLLRHLLFLFSGLLGGALQLFLQRLEVGQPLALETVDGRSHLYQVVNIDVVDSRRSSLLLDTEDSMVSLVTCYPFDALEPGGPMRYVVTARKLL